MTTVTAEKCHRLFDIALSIYGEVASNPYFGHHSDWKFSIEDCGYCYGLCDFGTKTIILNVKHFNAGNWNDIKDTILHECAHALAGIEISGTRIIGHGKLWKSWASRLGARPKATATLKSTPLVDLYRGKKYYIVSIVDGKVEVHSGSDRRLKNIEGRYFKHKPYTLKSLYHITTDDYHNANGNHELIAQKAFR